MDRKKLGWQKNEWLPINYSSTIKMKEKKIQYRLAQKFIHLKAILQCSHR